jgi:hypothetical protein
MEVVAPRRKAMVEKAPFQREGVTIMVVWCLCSVDQWVLKCVSEPRRTKITTDMITCIYVGVKRAGTRHCARSRGELDHRSQQPLHGVNPNGAAGQRATTG